MQINAKIQTFLASFGESYFTNLKERNLNSLDFGIYAAYKTQISILESKVKRKMNLVQKRGIQNN